MSADARPDGTASEAPRPVSGRTGHSKLAAADRRLGPLAPIPPPGRAPPAPRRRAGPARRLGLLLAIPATFIVLLLVGGPSLQTIIYSFQKVSFIGPPPLVGLDNYVRLLNSDEFKDSFRITSLYAAGFVLI